MQPSEWSRILTKYREQILYRSLFELAVTLAPFLAIWALAWWMVSISPWLALAVVNAGFLVRLLMIQHDCGHGAFSRDRRVCDWVGRTIGVVTLTPHDVWRKTHAIHHATTRNLDQRGSGDMPRPTVREYREKGWLGGWGVVLYVFLPTTFLAAVGGMWLFFVQHQFAETSWEHGPNWNVQDAAFYGSSHYDLPGVLRWLTGNIGVHHVHHLASRIPFYRMGEVIRDHDILAQSRRITLWQSFRCARLHPWDEQGRRQLSFAEARAVAV